MYSHPCLDHARPRMDLHSDPRRVTARLTVAYGLAGLTLAVSLLVVMGVLPALWTYFGIWAGAAEVLLVAWCLGGSLAPLYSRAGRVRAVGAGMLSALVALVTGAVCGLIPIPMMRLGRLDRIGVARWLLDDLVQPVGAMVLLGALPALVLGGLCGLHARRRLRAG